MQTMGMLSLLSVIPLLMMLALFALGIFITVISIQVLFMLRKIMKWFMKKNDIV